MDPNCAIRQNVPKAIFVTVVNPLDDIGRKVGGVEDLFHSTAVHIGQALLQLLGNEVEEL